MKLLAALILSLVAALIVGGFYLALRAAVRKYRETGSVLLEGRSGTQSSIPAWSVSWAGVPLIAAGATTLFKGLPFVGLALLALGITIAIANRIHEAKWRRGGG
jgi:hypothetical protein